MTDRETVTINHTFAEQGRRIAELIRRTGGVCSRCGEGVARQRGEVHRGHRQPAALNSAAALNQSRRDASRAGFFIPAPGGNI